MGVGAANTWEIKPGDKLDFHIVWERETPNTLKVESSVWDVGEGLLVDSSEINTVTATYLAREYRPGTVTTGILVVDENSFGNESGIGSSIRVVNRIVTSDGTEWSATRFVDIVKLYKHERAILTQR